MEDDSYITKILQLVLLLKDNTNQFKLITEYGFNIKDVLLAKEVLNKIKMQDR